MSIAFTNRGWGRHALLCAVTLVVAMHHGPSSLAADGPTLAEGALTVNSLHNAAIDVVRRRGLTVFTTPFNSRDGYGDGPPNGATSRTPGGGGRPTLQGNGMFLLVNGLDAQSCNECHMIVRHSSRPPTLGIGGVGGIVQNAIISPTYIDVSDSTSAHGAVDGDGTADLDGRVANPPFLFGSGGVELLAKEMTADLQRSLAEARRAPEGTITDLTTTHGVDFGHIETLADGQVALRPEGVGFEDNAGQRPEEVLVVRPFGRKGEFFSIRDFARNAMQFHFGMQPVEVVGQHEDPDGDGVVDEVSIADMGALHVFGVTNPPPFIERLGPSADRGFTLFDEIGCAKCHIPVLKTRSRFLPVSFPEVPADPWQNVYREIDLVEVGFEPVPGEDGVYVPLFADLKRHDVGKGLKESFARPNIPNAEFTTARLWGVFDTAPYLHDGRAGLLFQAISMHGGDAWESRNAFFALSGEERAQVMAFLRRLRTPMRPNEELLEDTADSTLRQASARLTQ